MDLLDLREHDPRENVVYYYNDESDEQAYVENLALFIFEHLANTIEIVILLLKALLKQRIPSHRRLTKALQRTRININEPLLLEVVIAYELAMTAISIQLSLVGIGVLNDVAVLPGKPFSEGVGLLGGNEQQRERYHYNHGQLYEDFGALLLPVAEAELSVLPDDV